MFGHVARRRKAADRGRSLRPLSSGGGPSLPLHEYTQATHPVAPSSFVERLVEMGEEHEELQRRFEALWNLCKTNSLDPQDLEKLKSMPTGVSMGCAPNLLLSDAHQECKMQANGDLEVPAASLERKARLEGHSSHTRLEHDDDRNDAPVMHARTGVSMPSEPCDVELQVDEVNEASLAEDAKHQPVAQKVVKVIDQLLHGKSKGEEETESAQTRPTFKRFMSTTGDMTTEQMNAQKKNPSRLEKFVTHWSCDLLCTLVICVNSFTIGYSAELAITEAMQLPGQGLYEPSPPMAGLDHFFLGFYILELLVKLFAFRLGFFSSVDWKWNCLDLTLVILALIDFILDQLPGGNMLIDPIWLRLLRLLRMLKLLRVVRVMRFFAQLRTMMYSIVSSMQTLFWSVLMLALIMYIFGLCFLQAISTFLGENSMQAIDTSDPELFDSIEKYWGSVYRSLITLFMAVTGGSDWEPLAMPLRHCDSIYFWLFLFYIAFTCIAVLNVLTGMVVDTTMIQSEADDSQVKDELTDYDEYKALRSFFMKYDKHRTDTTTEHVVQKSFMSEECKKFYKAMEMEPDHVRTIFQMLKRKGETDSQNSVHVDVDEFVQTMFKVRGERGAGSLEMVSIAAEMKRFMTQFTYLMEFSDDVFSALTAKVGLTEGDIPSLTRRLCAARCLPVKFMDRAEGLGLFDDSDMHDLCASRARASHTKLGMLDSHESRVSGERNRDKRGL